MDNQANNSPITIVVQDALEECIKELDEAKKEYLKHPNVDFTRNRLITFESFIRCCLQMEGSALQNEIIKYYEYVPETPTKSAFIQQRAKVLPEAFMQLFAMFVNKLSTVLPMRLLKGYRILAIDGSDINIPYNPSDVESSQANGNKKSYNQLHLNALQDVLNGFYVDAIVMSDKKSHERAAFTQMVDRNTIGCPCVYLGDRGYEGWNVFAHLIESGQKFVIRVKEPSSNGIISSHAFEYDENHEFDTYIETTLTYRQTNAVKENRQKYTYISKEKFDFFTEEKDEYDIRLRIVCIKVADGKFEYLATNLDEDEFSLSAFKELYHLRWNEESSFRDLKYTVGLLSFHCRKREYVEQEIWAGLVTFNFCEAIARAAVISQANKTKRKKKYDYLVNFSTAVCVCKGLLKKKATPTDALTLISKFIIPVRPGRSYDRKIKSQSARLFIYRIA